MLFWDQHLWVVPLTKALTTSQTPLLHLTRSQPSYVHVTQWAPATRSTSTPYVGGPSTNSSHSLQVEEPVDAFIDKLRQGQETAYELTFTNLQTESSVALLRAQEQQRLPSLELFKFTGKPIEWPKSIE